MTPGTIRKQLRKRKYGEPIVVVSGLPRSGTSMMMQMLVAGGLEAASDGVRAADEDNPRGYSELERIKDLDKGGDKSWVADLRGKAVKVVSMLLEDLPGDCFYQVVFMDRDLEEVLASQSKMLARRGQPADLSEEGRAKDRANYERHLRKVKLLLEERSHFEWIEASYSAVLEDPQGQAARVQRLLGRKLNVGEMARVPDASLHRNR